MKDGIKVKDGIREVKDSTKKQIIKSERRQKNNGSQEMKDGIKKDNKK